MHISSKCLLSKGHKSIYIVIVAVKAYHYELETENLIILVYARRTNRLRMNFVIGRCLRLCGYAIEIQAGEVDWNAWNSAGGGARGSAAAGEQTAATVLSVNPTVNRRERPRIQGDSWGLERALTVQFMNP